MKPAYLFLDVDGVLNSMRTLVAYGNFRREALDPVAFRLLERLHKELALAGFEMRVVISSTWRVMFPKAQWWHDLFESHCCPSLQVVGMTPDFSDAEPYRRGREVGLWLAQNCPREEQPAHYACLDDDADFSLEQHLVLVNPDYGLQPEHIALAYRAITGADMPNIPPTFLVAAGRLQEMQATAKGVV